MRNVNLKQLARLLRERPEIPDGKCGRVSVTHRVVPVSEGIDVVSMRNAILMGVKPVSMRFAPPLVIRTLQEKGRGVWMTDQPCEVWQMHDAVRELNGRVLVGGLGLGLATTFAALRPKVNNVVTIERSREVCRLVEPYVSRSVVCTDLYDYLRDASAYDYNSAFFDIWQSTGEWVWVGHVVPLRRLVRGKIEHVVCWLEDEMKGQLVLPLTRILSFDESVYLPHYYRVFRDAAAKRGIQAKTRISESDRKRRLSEDISSRARERTRPTHTGIPAHVLDAWYGFLGA